jgi:hypothetical protein
MQNAENLLQHTTFPSLRQSLNANCYLMLYQKITIPTPQTPAEDHWNIDIFFP